MTRPVCPYCGAAAMRTTGATIYPHRLDLADKVFYWCPADDAYVGTHAATGEPLGTLANAYLRRLRNQVHAVFDPLWRDAALRDVGSTKNQRLKKPKPFEYFIPQHRGAAYAALAEAMGLTVDQCHIGMFDAKQCGLALQLINCREIYRPR
jgi:hypothetical protein